MKQYEYKIVDLKEQRDKNEMFLNEQGAEGWELVQILAIPVPMTQHETLLKAIFKRPKEGHD